MRLLFSKNTFITTFLVNAGVLSRLRLFWRYVNVQQDKKIVNVSEYMLEVSIFAFVVLELSDVIANIPKTDTAAKD